MFRCRALLALLIGMPSLAQQPGSCAPALEPVRESITITASPLGPNIDLRNGAAFRNTRFTRSGAHPRHDELRPNGSSGADASAGGK